MNDTEVLSVRFEADVKALNAALATVDKRIDALEKGTDKAARNVKRGFDDMKISAEMLSRGVGLAMGAAVAAVIKFSAEAAKIGTNAEAVGLTVARYQELAAAARAAGGSNTQFAAGIERLTVNIAMLKNRQGELFETLKQGNPELLRQLMNTKSNSEAIDVFAEAVRRMDTAENKALLVKKGMGEGTMFMTKALEDGARGLDEAGKAAHKYGQVISDEAVKNTKELSKEMTVLWDKLKVGAAELGGVSAPIISKFFRALGESMNWYKTGGVDGGVFGDMPKKAAEASTGINKATEALGKWTTSVEKAFTLEKPDFRGADELMNLAQTLAQARGRANEAIALDAEQALERVKRMHAEGILSEQQYQNARAAIAATTEARVLDLRRQTEASLNDLRRAAAESNDDFYAALRLQYDRDLLSYQQMHEQKLITTEQFEEARNNLNAVASARIRDRMKEEADTIRIYLSGVEAAIEGPINSALGDVFRGRKVDVRDFFIELLAGINQAIVRMLILKPLMDGLMGGLGKFFQVQGGDVGMKTWDANVQRAEGGGVRAGVPIVVNERAGRKPEVFVPDMSGRIMPGERAGGSGGASVSNTYHIDARYADAGVENRIWNGLAAMERKRPNPVMQVREAQNRFPMRG